jgi:hypothetical protein
MSKEAAEIVKKIVKVPRKHYCYKTHTIERKQIQIRPDRVK